jgi:branched-subunit amino acid ABC-type transport system permease component
VAELLSAILRGMTFGSVYGLLAVGLVLTFKTSGVFNLAYGAQAFTTAAVYFDTRIRHHWSIPLALLLAVVIVAPLTGLILDRVLFRHLRTASSTARLVTVLGLLVAIPQAVDLWFGAADRQATGVVADGLKVYHPLKDVYLYRDDIATIAITVVIVIALIVLFRYTALGLRMRAVVESSRMTELAGVNAERVSMGSWMLASFIAGLSGVLIAPVLSQVNNIYFTPLVVAAISAAVLASLSSIPIAFAGGLGLGVLQQILSIYLPTNSILATNLRPSLPFVVLFLILIFSPRLRNRRDLADPLGGVAPPPPRPIAKERSRELTIGTRAWWTVVLGLLGYYIFFHANSSWVNATEKAVIYSIIFCSIIVITGMAGQISLCQATFAGIGGFVTFQLSVTQNMSVLLAVVIGAVVAAAVGAMLAIPVLRLGGIYLSLATLAFALFFDNVMVKLHWVSGSAAPPLVPRPQIGSIDFANEKSFLVLCLVILLLVGVALTLIRAGTTGRVLAALRGSEVASASIGINAAKARIVAFALSAAIAGLGGGLLATYNRQVGYQSNFIADFGLVWIVIVVTLGSRSFEGAMQAAFGFIFFPLVILQQAAPWIVNNIQPGHWYHMEALPIGLQPILFGLGALTYAKHPEGLLEFNTRKSLARIQARIDKFKAGRERRKLAAAGAAP